MKKRNGTGIIYVTKLLIARVCGGLGIPSNVVQFKTFYVI